MQFSSYAAFREAVRNLIEGEEVGDTFSTGTLDLIIGLAENRVYRDLRASCMVATDTLTVTNNLAPLPADLLELKAVWQDRDEPLEIVSLDRVNRLGANGGNAYYAALDGDNLRFAYGVTTGNILGNGTFDASDGWTLGDGWSVTGGKLVRGTASGGSIASHAVSVEAGKQYTITYTVSGYSSGTVFVGFGGGSNVSGTSRSANGTYTQVLTAVTGNNILQFVASTAGTSLSIDNVTVEVPSVTIDYYARPTEMKSETVWANQKPLARYPELFLFASVAEASPFLGEDARTPLWEQKYAQALAQANSDETWRAYSGSFLRIRAR